MSVSLTHVSMATVRILSTPTDVLVTWDIPVRTVRRRSTNVSRIPANMERKYGYIGREYGRYLMIT